MRRIGSRVGGGGGGGGHGGGSIPYRIVDLYLS